MPENNSRARAGDRREISWRYTATGSFSSVVPSRVVLVTGGSRGIGEALVEAFLDAGDSVATCSRRPTAQVEKWTDQFGDRFYFHEADLADRASCGTLVHKVIERYGRSDLLV